MANEQVKKDYESFKKKKSAADKSASPTLKETKAKSRKDSLGGKADPKAKSEGSSNAVAAKKKLLSDIFRAIDRACYDNGLHFKTFKSNSDNRAMGYIDQKIKTETINTNTRFKMIEVEKLKASVNVYFVPNGNAAYPDMSKKVNIKRLSETNDVIKKIASFAK